MSGLSRNHLACLRCGQYVADSDVFDGAVGRCHMVQALSYEPSDNPTGNALLDSLPTEVEEPCGPIEPMLARVRLVAHIETEHGLDDIAKLGAPSIEWVTTFRSGLHASPPTVSQAARQRQTYASLVDWHAEAHRATTDHTHDPEAFAHGAVFPESEPPRVVGRRQAPHAHVARLLSDAGGTGKATTPMGADGYWVPKAGSPTTTTVHVPLAAADQLEAIVSILAGAGYVADISATDEAITVTVWQRVDAKGEPVRAPKPRSDRISREDLPYDEIRHRYLDLEQTCAEIGRALNVSDETISRFLKDHGIPRRGRHGALLGDEDDDA